MRRLSITLLFALIAALGLSACEDESATEKAADNVEDAGDQASDAAEEAGDQVEEATD